MKYTLTGSLGNITKPLAIKLVNAGHQVTIISSQKERESQIMAIGAMPAIGQVEDIAFLTNAFKGADVVYTMIPPNYGTLNVIQNSHNIGKNFAAAIKAAGTKKALNLSSWGAHNPEGCGPVTGAYFVEQELNKLQGVDVLHLRPCFFYTNLLHSIGMIKQSNILGNNYGADTRMMMTHPTDIAAIAFEELSALQFSGKSFRYVASDESNFKEITAVLGKAIGKPDLQYVEFSDEAALAGYVKAGMNKSMAGSLVELVQATKSGKIIADYLKHPVELSKTKLEDFATEFAQIYKQSHA